MTIRIILGVLLGVLLIAFSPVLMKGLPYVLLLAAIGAAFFLLRTIPALAEPLGYGLLVVLVCYFVYLALYKRELLRKKVIADGKFKLPSVNIAGHQKISVLLNTLCYMLGLTFVLYIFILLIYVQ